jgi:glutamate racemase
VDIVVQPCPGLAEQVEMGDFSGAKTRALLERYVFPLLERGADTIVLGCTHYPFLQSLIEAMAGPGVAIIDPGEAIARELRRRLEHAGLLSCEERQGMERFWTSDSPESARLLFSQLWPGEVEVRALPEPYRKGCPL